MFKLEQDERLIMTLRKHWLVFLIQSFGFILAALIPFIVMGIFDARIFAYLASNGLASAPANALVMFAVCAWEMIILCVFAVATTNYFLDIVFVTNRRIIDLDQKGLFARDIAIMPIDQMQDIKIEVLGILATFFNFGNLYIQTAGKDKEIAVRGLRNPQEAKDAILNFYQIDRKEMR